MYTSIPRNTPAPNPSMDERAPPDHVGSIDIEEASQDQVLTCEDSQPPLTPLTPEDGFNDPETVAE